MLYYPLEWVVERVQKIEVKSYLFPVLTGLLAGVAAAAAMMLLGALAAVKLELAPSGYPFLVWLPVFTGAFAAGVFGAAFAKGTKLLCGSAAAVLLWVALVLLLREVAATELVRCGVMLLAGALGALMASRKRQRFKPGKAHARVRPRRGSF